MSGTEKNEIVRSFIRGTVFLFIFLLFFSALRGQHAEYKIKALLLGRIARQVTWPGTVGMNNLKQPFVIGVYGGNPFGPYLDEFYLRKLKPRKIKDKLVDIRYIKTVEKIAGCHLLFITDLSRKNLEKVLEFTQSRAILTVGDSKNYAERGVHICFVVEKKRMPRIGLVINEGAVRQSNMLMNQSLLRYASKIVNPYKSGQKEAPR